MEKGINTMTQEREYSGNLMLAESKFYMGYSRWDEAKGGYETWEESVARVMNMHRNKYANIMSPELDEALKFAQAAYTEKLVLGAQRALQFGGEQIFKHESRMYNCSVSYADRPAFFNECMYLMLSGCGVGFSVGKKRIAKLPNIARRSQKKVKLYQIPDSIEGWSEAFGVLLSSYFTEGATHPEYRGCQVHFDFTKIRPEGAKISGGFKAPGPDGLRAALIKCEDVLENLLIEKPVSRLNTISAYDFVMHMSDAVLSGGVRRSATICVFDKDDQAMLNAKTGDWFVSNPQRGRSNNSALIIRDDLERDEWALIMKSVKEFGEPGFIFADSDDFMFNPCVEIGMLPQTEDGRSGFQFCNLTEINGRKCVDKETFLRACRASAILGTVQAGYTNFKYVSKETKEITDREALIGCSITGWMNNPDILFDKDNMIEGARLVLEVNAQIADLIGINHAARGTCVKPSGNASTLLTSASGIHGEHAEQLFRHVQMNVNDEVAKHIMDINPKMVEKSVWSSNGTDIVVAFPIVTKPGSKYKSELLGVKQLEYVKLAQQYWVEYGTNVELCAHPKLRHNVSNTITVDNWDEVEQYLFDNREFFAGVSLMAGSGDKAYAQAPFTEVLTFEKIVKIHGEGSLFASGLIVEALRAYNENLWLACDTMQGKGLKLSAESEDLLKRDWIRRATKFASNYFNDDLDRMIACLKDCYNLHKWSNIVRSMYYIDFSKELQAQQYVSVDSLAGAACSGGTCELVW
jgi:ribonucleoside-diphosphate reductase alpha chain